MKGLTLFLTLLFVVPASAQNLTSTQTECTHVKSDSTRPDPTKPNETNIGNLVCRQGVPNPTPAQPRLKLGEPPADVPIDIAGSATVRDLLSHIVFVDLNMSRGS